MSKARFILLIGDSERETNPNSLYVYEPPLSALNSDSSPPYLKLSNGGSLASKYPALYGELQGATVRNRTVVITDSSSGYLLFAFDTNSTTAPLLYSINEAKMIQSFAGAASLQTMLNQQYQVFTLLSSGTPMNFYSIKKYYKQEEYVGPDPDGKPTLYCIFELGSWSFNDSTMVPTKGGLKLNRVYFESSICKDDSDSTVTVSKKCKYPKQCLNWDVMAAFANEKRIYMLGRSMVYAVENAFAGSNVDKKKLSVVSFKLTDFFVTETPLRTTGTMLMILLYLPLLTTLLFTQLHLQLQVSSLWELLPFCCSSVLQPSPFGFACARLFSRRLMIPLELSSLPKQRPSRAPTLKLELRYSFRRKLILALNHEKARNSQRHAEQRKSRTSLNQIKVEKVAQNESRTFQLFLLNKAHVSCRDKLAVHCRDQVCTQQRRYGSSSDVKLQRAETLRHGQALSMIGGESSH